MARLSLLLVLCAACGPRQLMSEGGLRLCPSAGGQNCFLLTPAEAGLSGEGAKVDQYALRPSGAVRGRLLVFLNGSGSEPAAATVGLATSWYGVARSEGLHVLGVSYRSGAAIGVLCQGVDTCFEPSRMALVTGAPTMGAANALANVTVDEGIEQRIAAALKMLSVRDPEGGWGEFLEGEAVRWERLLVSGHSQGGGHAALLGKRHRLERVIMLASPCDSLADGTPAQWLSSSTGWATPPERFTGLWTAGDAVCPSASAIWQRLGVPSAAQLAQGVGCSGIDAHTAPLQCVGNGEHWRAMVR